MTGSKRVVVVGRDGSEMQVLARALEARDWSVATMATGPGEIVKRAADRADVLVAILDGDEAAILELLARLSGSGSSPPVLLLTRRGGARALGPASLRALGVDRLLVWPCRPADVAAAMDEVRTARRAPAADTVEQAVRMVS